MSEKNYSIVLGAYKGIQRPSVTVTVTDEEIQAALLQEQQKCARLETVNGPAALGHTVVIDFAGFLGEEQFEGGTSENYPLELGSGSFIPGFEEQLVGASAGDSVDVNVTFPQNYHAENLAGKPVVFKCKVHQVQEKKLPELNDLFAKRYHAPNMDALRENIRQSMTQQKQPQAEAAAKASAALETIAEIEGLSVAEEEIDADIRRMAAMYGMPYEDLAKDITADKREIIQNGMLMTKTLAFLMDASVEA